MGCCLSKKDAASPPLNAAAAALPNPLAAVAADKLPSDSLRQQQQGITVAVGSEDNKQPQEEGLLLKKEIFVIKHRKSHDRAPPPPPPPLTNNNNNNITNVAVADAKIEEAAPVASDDNGTTGSGSRNTSAGVRTSSCTKEEVDAILIQCGRLSRSNSSGAGKSKYSGSKRSYDFDHNDQQDVIADDHYDAASSNNNNNNNNKDIDERRQHRQRHRQSGRPSPSHGRRRTPSRERERDQQISQQRSGSRERNSGGRRVSRSPGRRSETTPPTTATTTNNNNTNAPTNNRPGKMVSVPPTVSCLETPQTQTQTQTQTSGAITRISVKRNVCDQQPAPPPVVAAPTSIRGTSSPRSQSPSRFNHHQPSLSRSSSRKADHSPYRRIPLTEIDTNSLPPPTSTKAAAAPITITARPQPSSAKEIEAQVVAPMAMLKPASEASGGVITHGTKGKASGIGLPDNKQTATGVGGGEGSLNPQKITRSRSSRRSRDLDLINPEALLNQTATSYTTLLLEDIQNFHQKNTNPPPPAFTLPHCVTKACSILEAVADLNSTTSSNLSCAFSEDRRSPPEAKKAWEARDPFVESEVGVDDDLMEPSIHKYVTVRRGGGGEDMDGQESSGSNSFVGGGAGSSSQSHHWGISTSSSWEPNSADSTDRWSSRSNTTTDDKTTTPLGLGLGMGFQRQAFSESANHLEDASRRTTRRLGAQRTGIGRGRLASKIPHATTTTPVAVTFST
ncbi:hypothetical protein Tsubulata_024639 [Turnera subulata]|uniref:Uncharacterized protein n=1 Tax=Turnera subulata TaxID=218843 RepID=A0A9Q0FVN4_9ROSI|nr:hypothetical protein Tsubulata_024639 [Turnera subulata]